MSKYTYKDITNKAKTCQSNVKKEYKTGLNNQWSYYFAKAIITPKKDITQIKINDAPKPSGNTISRQISKTDYIGLCKDYTKFIEKNKRLPNYLTYKSYKLTPHLLTEVFSRILVYYDKNNKLPATVNVNSKVFTKPVETGNKVYDYFVKKTGKKFTTIDDLLTYVKKNFTYQYYYDDHKSNQQVTDTKSGNCTDLLQWLCNMVEPMGYEWKCIHVKCKSSGSGHVFGKFKHKKHTENTWITRDIACVADGGDIKCVWCKDGTVQATNPSWWMENLHR